MSMTNTDILNELSAKIIETSLEGETHATLEKSEELLTHFDNKYKQLITFLTQLKKLDKDLAHLPPHNS